MIHFGAAGLLLLGRTNGHDPVLNFSSVDMGRACIAPVRNIRQQYLDVVAARRRLT